MARLRIAVARMGDPNWPRYAIQDNKGRFWTGRWWTDSPHNAVLYNSEADAADEATLLNDCIEPRWFVATIRIMVEHDEPYNVQQLQDLLKQSAVSLILPDEHDMDGVDVEIDLDLGGIEEIE
jgi:hypothetical protein